MGGQRLFLKSVADQAFVPGSASIFLRIGISSRRARHGSKGSQHAFAAMPLIEAPLVQDGQGARDEPRPQILIDASNVDNSIPCDVAPGGFEQRKRQINTARYSLLSLQLRVLALRLGMTTAVLGFHDSNLPRCCPERRISASAARNNQRLVGAATQDVDEAPPRAATPDAVAASPGFYATNISALNRTSRRSSRLLRASKRMSRVSNRIRASCFYLRHIESPCRYGDSNPMNGETNRIATVSI